MARSLAKCPWLRRGDLLLAAVSGGPDSTALMHALVPLHTSGQLRIAVVHVDHGLRPESAGEARQVRAAVEAAGLRCLVLQAAPRIARSGPMGQAGGLEQVAREARYRLLARAARRTGARAIAVAHTVDDQAETVLLRLLRGAGPRGLGGMRPVASLFGARVIRPMLDCTRAEVLASVELHHATPLRDASNADLSRERNWLRHEILPRLTARWGQSLPRRIARGARLSRAAAEAQERAGAEAFAAVATPSLALSARSIALDAPQLASYSCAVQRSIVRHALRELAGTLSGFSLEHVTRIVALAVSPSPRTARASHATDLPHGLRVTTKGATIILEARAARPPGRDPAIPHPSRP